ncbi:SMP-30/gluconolactonase/LRE family protein [Aeromicrobium sp. 9AM]|uniref:SMP-30/gluconolactonase/LRE family protein n=1 Tax=Aeromicrobium sp. 9AM TaxID=2653126 RepID=UPI0012F23345|nr:SMP-30/gluconolactonase/LRE family protein [Aeromicrobium sp. 9AM]VXB62794.1 Gluconolactonase protein [Aeromicrobium sp. 9AM]
MSDGAPVALIAGVGHPQGPDVTDDGSIVYAETYLSRIMIFNQETGPRVLADCGGGPNAVLVGRDGLVYFTQNGGQAGEWRSDVQRVPAVEVLDPGTGDITTLCTDVDGHPLLAPHDLAWGPDGRLYVTDSGTWAPGGRTEPGRIFAIDEDGHAQTIAEPGHVFPSGIAVEPDCSVLWAEAYTSRVFRLRPDAAPQLVTTLPDGHVPESIALDHRGHLWIAALEAHGFDVVAPNGGSREFVWTGGLPLNGVLARGHLYVTDLGDYDDAMPDPQIVGRILQLAVGVEAAPQTRGRIAPSLSSPTKA